MKVPFYLRVLMIVLSVVFFFVFLPFRIMSLFRKQDQPDLPKLYRNDGASIQYWEAWSTGTEGFVVHWGKLGEQGESETVPPEDQDRVFSEFAARQAEGFAPIDHDDLYGLEITCPVDGFGGAADLKRRHALQAHLDELLGWTGLGHVDGGSIGSGTMEVFAYVVDPDIATRIVTENLKDSEWRDFDEITIHPPYNQWSDEDKGLTGQPA